MSFKGNKLWKFFSSLKLAIGLLAAICFVSLLGTLIPQWADLYSTWWFMFLLGLFSLNLTGCLLNRFSQKDGPIGTLLCHISILVILLGALIGAVFGEKGYVEISKGQAIGAFLSGDKKVNLGFSLRLDDFIYSEAIDPKEGLLVYSCHEGGVCKMHEQPGAKCSHDPLAKITTEVGAEAEIADTGYRVKILRYLPDFVWDISIKEAASRSTQANNPAIEIELQDKNGEKKIFWVFARYPDVHQQETERFNFVYQWEVRRPKEFVSKIAVIKEGKEVLNKDIRVNSPLQFGGYSFFQSSYDTDGLNWSGLRVVKDPGVGIVYSGFFLLIAGLCVRFYISPLLKAKRARRHPAL